LTAGNAVSNASDLAGSIGFSILALLPVSVGLFLSEKNIFLDMGLAILLYFALMVVIGRFINKNMIRSSIMQYKAELSEKEAWASEERYRLILQHSPAGILHYNKDLIITYCNDRFGDLLKTPKENLIGLDMKTLKDQRILPPLRAAIEGHEGSYEGEYRSTISDILLWLIMFYAPLRDADGMIDGGIAIIEDITERKVAEKESSKLLNNLIQAEKIAKIGNWHLDLQDNTLEWSDEIYNIFELDKNRFQPTYDAFINIIHPDDRIKVASAYENSLVTKQKYEITHRLQMEDGRIKYVYEQCETRFDPSGKPLCSLGTVQDVSEQIQNQIRLEKSENTLLSLLEMSPIAVRIAKTGGSEVVYANDAYARLIHADKTTVLGKNPKNYYANKHDYDEILMLISSQEIIYDKLVELYINNQTVWALASYMPIEFEGEACVLGWFYDITEEKNLQQKLEQQKEEFETIFNISKDGIAILDLESNFLDFNESYLEMTGFTREKLLATSCIALSIPEDSERAKEAMKGVIEHGYVKGFEKTCIVNNKKHVTINMTLTLLPDKQRILISTKDITANKEYERELEYGAHYDALTGLPNRVLKSDRLRQAMIQSQRRETKVAVLYLDLDGFKEVNDHYGHPVGDQLLIALSERMKQVLRDGDTLSRLGGDEFVAIIVDMNDTAGAIPIIHRLLEAASKPINVGDLIIQVSASIGVTFYPQYDNVDGDQLIRQADQAMYEAKQSGKNRYHIFDPAHDRTIRLRHENIERIRQALNDNEFVLYYQPKINMRTNELIGAEALIRWDHPGQGLILPLEFLPVIENHQLAIDIGEWVINEAIEQIKHWQKAGIDLPVSVNVGAKQLLQDNFVERLRSILSQHDGFDSSYLQIEILETSALEDVNHAAQIIEECKKFGVQFALDDFGTGYSSLTYLKRLPVSTLKIDRSFVHDMLNDADDLAILEGIVNLANTFNREVIAEGVESIEHGQRLLLLGCDQGQGYGIARPMPAEKLLAWSQHFTGWL
jgi:diguanylate cyclase (GGDEF)-like protein/PAS domain S-box-containing protein